MGALSNLGGWFQLAEQGGGQVRQALGQTVANIGSRVTPKVFGAGPISGLSNSIAGTNVTGTYDKPYIQPKPASMITSQVNSNQTLGAVSTGGGGGGSGSQPQPSGDSGYRDPDFGNPSNPDLSNPIKQTAYKRYMESRGLLRGQQQQPTIDYDALIQPALQALDQAVAPQQSSYDANLAQIEANRSKGIGEFGSIKTANEQDASTSRQRVTGQTESAVDEVRRQFAEIQQGLQSRYGGTTGAGAFVEGLAGRQALQNIGQKRKALTEAISTIDNQLQQVNTTTDLAIQDANQQAEAQKAQAKAQLDNALNSIRIARGEVLSRKVELAQEAMKFYQQQVAQVDAQNAQFLQGLYTQQQAAQQRLAEAKATANNQIKQYQFVNADTQSYVFNPYTGAYKPVQKQQYGAGQLGGNVIGGQSEEDKLQRLNSQVPLRTGGGGSF